MSFDESLHPRGQTANAGQFREVVNTAPASELSDTAEAPAGNHWRILADRLGDLSAAVEKANKRLERAGVEERFDFTFTKSVWRDEHDQPWMVADVELNRPTISVGAWDFVAAHEKTAAGQIISHFRGNDDRSGVAADESMRCDHCGHSRARQKVFTLRDRETGELKQIGSNCLKLFLGIRPEGLWAMSAEVGAEIRFDEDDFRPGTAHERAFEGEELLLGTLRQIETDGEFLSRSRAGYRTPTMDKVKGNLAELTAQPATKSETDEIAAVIAWVDSLTPAEGYDGDYERNLQAAFVRDDEGLLAVERKHAGLVGSAISSYRHALARKARDEARAAFDATKAQEFVFTPGENLRGKDLELRVIKAVLGQDYGYGQPLHVTFMDDEGHILYWKASSGLYTDVDLGDGETTGFHADEGDRVRIVGGSVKEHRISTYNGDHETVLTRVKIAPTGEKLALLQADHAERVAHRADVEARNAAASAEARAYNSARLANAQEAVSAKA